MENLQPESVSRETLIKKYFPGQEEQIQAYAEFLATAGIERGLIARAKASGSGIAISLTACPSHNSYLKGRPSLISALGQGCPGL
jgi:hypothetical protein